MTENKIWDFDCPQFVDFSSADDFNPDAESYFDKHDEIQDFFKQPITFRNTASAFGAVNSKYGIDEKKLKPKRLLVKNNISVTDAFSLQLTNNSEANPFASLKIQCTENSTLQHPENPDQKDRKIKVAERPTRKSLWNASKTEKPVETLLSKSMKKMMPPVNPIHRRRKRSVSSSDVKCKKKATCPTTPECLKRSIKVTSKKIKSTEDRELDRIAELRKQLANRLKSNKATMKKMTHTSIIRPPENKFIPKPPENKYKLNAASADHKVELAVGEKQNHSRLNPINSGKCEDFVSSHSFLQSTELIRSSTCYSLKDKKVNPLDVTLKDTIKSALKTAPFNDAKAPISHTGLMFVPKQVKKNIPQPFAFEQRKQICCVNKTDLTDMPKNKALGSLVCPVVNKKSSVPKENLKPDPLPRQLYSFVVEQAADQSSEESQKNVPCIPVCPVPKTKSSVPKENLKPDPLPCQLYSSEVERIADQRSKEWQKNIEADLEKQRASLFKKPLFKSVIKIKPGNNQLKDITSSCHNTQKTMGQPKRVIKKAEGVLNETENKSEAALANENDVMNLRATLVHKATPIKHYKQIEVKSNKKTADMLLFNRNMITERKHK